MVKENKDIYLKYLGKKKVTHIAESIRLTSVSLEYCYFHDKIFAIKINLYHQSFTKSLKFQSFFLMF